MANWFLYKLISNFLYFNKLIRIFYYIIILFGGLFVFPNKTQAQSALEEEISQIHSTIIKDSDSALSALKNLYNSNKSAASSWEVALIFEAFGTIYKEKSEYTKALEYFLEAKEKYESIDSIKTANSLYPDIGAIYLNIGEIDKATNAYMQGVRAAEQFNDIVSMARCFQNMGNLYSSIEDNKLALKYYNKALALSKQIPNYESNKAGILQNLGILYSTQRKLDSAIIFYKQSLSIFQELNETVNMAITYNNLGVLYERMSLSDSTIAYYKKALDIFYEIDYKRGISISLYNIGQTYRNKGELQKALEYVYKSQEIAEEIKLKEQIQSNYYELSWIYEEKKDFEKSLEYMILAYDWKDTLYTIEQALQISEFEAIYESEKKEKEILELEKKRERERTFIILLVGSIILLIMLVIFILVFHKLKEKAVVQRAISKEQTKHFKAVIEAQEEERKRLAGELHDSVGPLLSVTQLYISDLAETTNKLRTEENELFNKSLQILEEACNETRNISHNLMPGVLIRSGLISAIRELTNIIKDTNQFKVSFESNEIKLRFEESIEITYYRIFQELLNNIIKHSNATEISVSFKFVNNNLLLSVKDNGKGLNVNKIKDAPGIGWKSIYSRLSLINGNVHVDSDKNGTNVLVTSPVS